MAEWDNFYKAFAPGGVLATGQPAFAPPAQPAGYGPPKRVVSTVSIDPRTGMPMAPTAEQIIGAIAAPTEIGLSTDVQKTYDDRLPAGGPLAYSGTPAENPNPFGLPPVNGGWPYVPATPAPTPVQLANPAGGVAHMFGGAPAPVPPADPTAAVYAAHAAPGTALSSLASMFSPSPNAPPAGPTSTGTNGYTYAADPAGGYSRIGRADPSLTPAQQYDAANAGRWR